MRADSDPLGPAPAKVPAAAGRLARGEGGGRRRSTHADESMVSTKGEFRENQNMPMGFFCMFYASAGSVQNPRRCYIPIKISSHKIIPLKYKTLFRHFPYHNPDGVAELHGLRGADVTSWHRHHTHLPSAHTGNVNSGKPDRSNSTAQSMHLNVGTRSLETSVEGTINNKTKESFIDWHLLT